MATRSTNITRKFLASGQDVLIDVPVVASDIVYEGSAVGESSTTGTGRPLVGADSFMGFCVRQCDNSSGSANDKKIRVMAQGLVQLTITGVDNINDEGATVYASDDDTFTLTNSTGHSSIGKLVSVDDTTNNLGTVFFQSVSLRSI